jgi:superfamily II RNA helicase
MFRDGKQDEIEQVSDAIHTVKLIATKHRSNADFLQRVGIMAKKAAPHYKPPDCKRMPRPPDAKSKRSWLKTSENKGRSPQAKHPDIRMFTDPDHR